MAKKTPAVNGRGMETLTGIFHGPITLAAFQTQRLAARFALPLETAAILATLAFGGAAHD